MGRRIRETTEIDRCEGAPVDSRLLSLLLAHESPDILYEVGGDAGADERNLRSIAFDGSALVQTRKILSLSDGKRFATFGVDGFFVGGI